MAQPGMQRDSHSTEKSDACTQVRVIPKHLIYKPNLYELQTIALSSLFLLAISPVAWNQIGFGLRRAQDVGAHRRMKQAHPTAEHEQWKRVFWYFLPLSPTPFLIFLKGPPLFGLANRNSNGSTPSYALPGL
jgi:hypothetical protein